MILTLVSVSLLSGYSMSGVGVLACQSNGTWSDPAFNCSVTVCAPLQEILNSEVKGEFRRKFLSQSVIISSKDLANCVFLGKNYTLYVFLC